MSKSSKVKSASSSRASSESPSSFKDDGIQITVHKKNRLLSGRRFLVVILDHHIEVNVLSGFLPLAKHFTEKRRHIVKRHGTATVRAGCLVASHTLPDRLDFGFALFDIRFDRLRVEQFFIVAIDFRIGAAFLAGNGIRCVQSFHCLSPLS